MKTTKSIYEKELESAIVLQDPPKFHPKYEQAGKWARGFIKQYAIVLIMYGIFGTIFSFTYVTGGYPALIISIALTIIYIIRNLK